MTRLSKLKTVLLSTLTVFTTASHALDAPAAMVPAGLNPGDEFYIIFVTSTSRDATSTDINDYNTHVNTAADLSSTKGTDDASITWRVVGATAADNQCDPYNGDGTANTPTYNLNGDIIATDRTNILDGAIDNDIMYNQQGIDVGVVRVWTGCNTDGSADAGNELGHIGTVVTRGNAYNNGGFWINSGTDTHTDPSRFYAISPKLTVPAAVAGAASAQAWD